MVPLTMTDTSNPVQTIYAKWQYRLHQFKSFHQQLLYQSINHNGYQTFRIKHRDQKLYITFSPDKTPANYYPFAKTPTSTSYNHREVNPRPLYQHTPTTASKSCRTVNAFLIITFFLPASTCDSRTSTFHGF